MIVGLDENMRELYASIKLVCDNN